MADDSRKLYRSRDKRMIAGVCGGLGEYIEVDPTSSDIVCSRAFIGTLTYGLHCDDAGRA